MESVLITGATGFVGHRLAKQLALSHRIVAAGRRDPQIERVAWIPMDLATPDFVRQLPAGIDAVIHLAAATRGDHDVDAVTAYKVNTRSTELLVEWSEENHVGKFLLASTGSVYGGGAAKPYREDDQLADEAIVDTYTATKIAAEAACRQTRSLIAIIVRLFFPYGNGQSIARLIPRLCRSIAQGASVTIQGEDGISINPIHVSDAAAALAATLRLQSTTTINVAGPEVVTMGEILRLMSARIGRQAVIDHQPDIAPKHLVGDIALMMGLLDTPLRRLTEELRIGLTSLFEGGAT